MNRCKLIFLIFLACSALVAEIPETIFYQGKLTSPTGVGVNDTLPFVFSIFNIEAGGTALWTEGYTTVPIVKGLFEVTLGSVLPIDLSFDNEYWLQISVDGHDLVPRSNFSTSPYAFRAKYADSVGTINWGDIDGMPPGFADGTDDGGTIYWWDILSIPAGFRDGIDNVDDDDHSRTNELIWTFEYDDVTDSLWLFEGCCNIKAVHIDNEADDLSDNVLDDLGDVNTAGLTLDQIIRWNGSEWVPDSDWVNDDDPDPNNELITSVVWINATHTLVITEGTSRAIWTVPIPIEEDDLSDNSLFDLGDVDTTGGFTGKYLMWDGTSWVIAGVDSSGWAAHVVWDSLISIPADVESLANGNLGFDTLFTRSKLPEDTMVVFSQFKIFGELIADSIQAVGDVIELDDSIAVHGSATIDGNLTVGGNIYFDGLLHGNKIHYDTLFSETGNIFDTTVTMSQFKVHGELIADSIQAVGDVIELDDSIAVHGSASIDGNISASGNLDVSGIVGQGKNFSTVATIADIAPIGSDVSLTSLTYGANGPGSTIFLSFDGVFDDLNGYNGASIIVELVRNPGGSEVIIAQTELFVYNDDYFAKKPISINGIDEPPAGTHTYEIRARSVSLPFDGGRCLHGHLILSEIKG
ncbi:hypothetical protein KAH81_08380 [bacterium]|nr:hypothetical protein [bacterium]